MKCEDCKTESDNIPYYRVSKKGKPYGAFKCWDCLTPDERKKHGSDFKKVELVEPIPPSDQLREELHAVIKRYGIEADTTIYQVIGALEAVKMDLWDHARTKT